MIKTFVKLGEKMAIAPADKRSPRWNIYQPKPPAKLQEYKEAQGK